MKPKNIVCLWFDKDAEEAARFYAATFPDSAVTGDRGAFGAGGISFGEGGAGDFVEFTI